MSTPHIEHFMDERGNFIYRAEFEGSFLSKDEVKALGKYVSGILDENAKLREERDTYRDLVGCMVHPDIPDQLYAENVKLRELVRYAYECAIHSSHATCDECKEWNSGCILADRMRELGMDAELGVEA